MSRLRIAQITDLHLTTDNEPLMGLDTRARMEAVLHDAASRSVNAFLFTGDFCAREPVEAVFAELRGRFDRLGKEYFLVPGNHDSREMVARHFSSGEPVPWREGRTLDQIVTIGGRLFICVDTQAGRLSDEQVAWLENALILYPDADVVMHHPPIRTGNVFMDGKYPLHDRKRVAKVLCADGRNRNVFCGHQHAARAVRQRGLAVWVAPPTSFFLDPMKKDFQQVEAPPAYRLLEWDEGGRLAVVQRVVSTED